MIRVGKPDDLPAVYDLIMELAIYEKAAEEVNNSVQRMQEDGFGANPIFGFFVCEEDDKIIGTAIYYFRYSTWKGKALYLEDLIVSAEYRGRGHGKALLDAIVEQAKKTKCHQVRWQVLDWNTPAIEFYKSLQADLDDEWINCTLNEDQINNY